MSSKGNDTDPEYSSEEEEEREFNLQDLANELLISSKGQNIPDVIYDLKKCIDTQNKILLKLLSTLEQK